MNWLFSLLIFIFSTTAWANKPVVNLYIWEGVIADEVIQQFENETGIVVNISMVDSNETLFTKLKTLRRPTYDIIMPTTDYLERLRNQGMLEHLDRHKLPNIQYLDPFFLHREYDPENAYSLPFIWGVTGIALNHQYFSPVQITQWKDLWKSDFRNRLLMINDSRELFSMALIALGFQVNDQNPEHLRLAYEKLKALLPNIKIYVADIVKTIYADEDALVGMVFNGDLYKIQADNPNFRFIYPEDGFVIWTHSLAIPKNAPHLDAAHRFLNFLMRPEIAVITTTKMGYTTANLSARKLLPHELQENPILFPSEAILSSGQFERDVSDQTLSLYEKYWQLLKLQS
jgi:spermidine/putrescine transport system substrate-binding protein